MNGAALRRVFNVKKKIEIIEQYEVIWFDAKCREILKLVYKHVDSLEEIAKTTLDTSLDDSISKEVFELGEIIDEIGASESKSSEDWVQLENSLKQRIDSFATRLKMEEQRCADGLYNLIPGEEEEEEEEEDNDVVVSSKMIGVSDVYKQLKETLLKRNQRVISLVGMPGIGKTTLAKEIIHDSNIRFNFTRTIWVRMGKNCRIKDVPRRILEEMDPDILPTLPEGDEAAVVKCLHESLRWKKYLIVLDDVWDRFALYLLHPDLRYKYGKLKHPFLHERRTQILITSRLKQLQKGRADLSSTGAVIEMRLLNKEESWNLLCNKVFCKGSSCPPQFEKAGREISENCDGLPLTIVTIARMLSEEKTSTLEYWNEVAAKKDHQLFENAYDEMSKVLLPSYNYLPRLLQMCFLFIGLFPRNHEIPRSRLINLWVADGFFESNINIKSKFDAFDCLEELISNNVVIVYKKSNFNLNHTVKTCGHHSSLWYLSRKITRKTKFAYVLSRPSDCLGDGMEGHPRLSFNNNVLFGMKYVNKSVEDNCAATRSLLCFGPYHQYQVPLCFHLKLLRELDALSIRFYEFPIEVLQLVRLKYLALTSNGTIPPSISQLSILQFLIVNRHQNIRSCRDDSYLPVEIWDLQELDYLDVMGSDLPDPCGASLKRLSTLLNVSTRSCTEAVFKGVPCLTELKVRIELTPDDEGGKSLGCLPQFSYLRKLKVLKYIIVNPELVPPVVPFSIFTRNLSNLSLSGLGYPWKELEKIASLPCLSVLKLKNYAFQGPKWEVKEKGFGQLNCLVVEDTDLEDWHFASWAFEKLVSVTFKSCYKLEKIHADFGSYFQKLEVVDCNPSCIAKIKHDLAYRVHRRKHHVFIHHSSWDEEKLKK